MFFLRANRAVCALCPSSKRGLGYGMDPCSQCFREVAVIQVKSTAAEMNLCACMYTLIHVNNLIACAFMHSHTPLRFKLYVTNVNY